MKRYNVAIIGATGLVGSTFLKVLNEREFPIKQLFLFASCKSSGKKINYNNQVYTVEELTKDSFKNRKIDIALFSAGGETSQTYAPIAKENGVIVIDNSSAWRMEEEVPLVVPEVNPKDVFSHHGIIANPNCSTIQCVLPLKILHDNYGIKRIVYSTYQAVSGSGMAGLNDLKDNKTDKYPYPIQGNCLPHIDAFDDNGYTKEEVKMIEETKKILHDANLKITATTVRVPVKYGHCVSINVELYKPFDLKEIFLLFKDKEGIMLYDDVKNNVYPMPIIAEGKDEVYVGRIRRDFSLENGLNLFVVSDNIRKGAATNAVQIAEILIKE